MFTLCRDINAPIKMSKVEGPTISLIFLGIHLDSKTMEASISDERKCALLDELSWMRHQVKCTKRELLSLSFHFVVRLFHQAEYSFAE